MSGAASEPGLRHLTAGNIDRLSSFKCRATAVLSWPDFNTTLVLLYCDLVS